MRELLLSLFAVLSLVSCAARGDRRAVASVNGVAVTVADVTAALPNNLDSTRADTVKRQVLDNLVTKKLFVQEATRLGLDKDPDVEYQVELEQKALVNQLLYDTIVASGNKLTDMEVQSAYKLLQTEAHVRIISVPEESTARRLVAELDKGAPFETLAVRFSRHGSAVKGGDIGFVSYLYLPEPLRTRVMVLKPGEHTAPTAGDAGWEIAQVVETRPANPSPPPLGEYRQELEFRLKQQRRRELATQYLTDLRGRLTYNPEGLDILCKPLDSITEQEKDVAVCVKDKARYVKVTRLLNVAARFPALLDTAMKKYTVRRTIEEDLIYEDALARGLDKAPGVQERLKRKREDVLYQTLVKKEIVDKISVSDSDVMDYYRSNRQNFTSQDSTRVAGMIRSRLQGERKDAALAEYIAALKGKAQIKINEAVLKSVNKDAKPAAGKTK
jgi:peptidyl-prolyl cis-trans isomerase C